MKILTIQKTAFFLTIAITLTAATQAAAQASRRGLSGDWKITTQFGERQVESILAFSRDTEGNRTGAWISFWGLTELKDLKYEDNKLSFTQTFRGRDGERTSSFKGALEEGKLTGTLSSDRGEFKVVGERAARVSRAVGQWAMKVKVREREFTGTLSIKNDPEGKLAGEWKSQRGEQVVKELVYSRGELAFERTVKIEDNEFETAFTGNIRGNALTGGFKSDRGEAEAVGERVNGALIGTWTLDIESERGPRKQRLRVNADMSALYGSTVIDKINFADNKLGFKVVWAFGDRQFETEFQATLDGTSLTGERTSSQGKRKVTGKKVERSSRRAR